MNQSIYFLADLYPWWGIPLAFILIELGNSMRRRGQRRGMFVCMTLGFVLLALAVAYFFYNGMVHMRPMMHEFEKTQ